MGAGPISNPKVAAERGETIYAERYKDAYERDHPGMFVAIDVVTGEPYISETPEGVLDAAYKASPGSMFHLIQVGHGGAFRVSYTQAKSSGMDWIF